MSNTLETSITSFSEDDFSALFSESTPNPPVQEQEETIEDLNPEIKNNPNKVDPFAIESFESLDDVPDIVYDEDGEPIETEEVEVTDEEGITTRQPSSVTDLYKSLVDKYVEEGLWADFEERETAVFDAKKFQKLAVQQEQRKIEEKFNDTIESTGEYGKAIINFIKDGGDPDQIIDLFKEQRMIDSYEPTDDADKIELITAYYKDQLEWKPERINKLIKNLEADDELDDEVNAVKESYSKINKSKIDQLREEQRIQKEQAQRAEEEYRVSITTELKKKADLTETQKRHISEALLNYDQPLEDGRMVNKFYLKVAEIQADPARYIDLVRFVMDQEAFLQDYGRKIKNETKIEDFTLLGKAKPKTEARGKSPKITEFTFK